MYSTSKAVAEERLQSMTAIADRSESQSCELLCTAVPSRCLRHLQQSNAHAAPQAWHAVPERQALLQERGQAMLAAAVARQRR